MGTWGINVPDNDTYADVYGAFFELFDKGLKVPDITAELMIMFGEYLDDPDESNNFWFALAKAQSACQQLDPALYMKVRAIIDLNTDIKVWEDMGADEAQIEDRKIVLQQFLSELQ